MSAKIIVKYNNLDKIARRLPEATDAVIRKTAFDIAAYAKDLMSGPRHGRIYGTHQASAPGEPPAVDTGNLKNSIGVELVAKAKAIVFAAAEYASSLEFGTRRIAPRPFMRPAVEKILPAFITAISRLEEMLK